MTPLFSRSDPEALEALRPVLEHSKPSRFRLLTVVCHRNHALLRVYRTSIGPVLVSGARGIDYPATDFETTRIRVVGRLDDVSVAGVTCRCSTARIPRSWLAEQLATGRRRVVWNTT